MDNNRAIALGFGEQRFSNVPLADWLAGAHTGSVCIEYGSRKEGGLSLLAEERGRAEV